MRPVAGFVDFVQRVLGVTLTPGQRVAALVFFDGWEPGQFEGSDRDIARQLFGPIDAIPTGARGVVLLLKGARIGGSYVFAGLYSLWRALVADLSTLAPGEQATALVVAPDLRLARQVLRYALGAARSVPSIASLIESETSDAFVLRRPDGRAVAVEVLPATRGGSALRGRSLVSAVLSEAAFFRDESAVINDQELFRACSPRVLSGGLLVVETTPWAEQGLAYDLFTANWGSPTTCVVAHAPTLLMRTDAQTAANVAREEERDPENARREFGAEFMTGGAGLFFDGSSITLADDPDLLPCHQGYGRHVGIGGDVGLVRDSSAIVSVQLVGSIYCVAEALEFRPERGSPLKLSKVVADFCELAGRHGACGIVVDQHALEPAKEHLPAGFQLWLGPSGQTGKAETYLQAKKLLNEGRVRIPAQYRRLITQLRAIMSRPTPGGGLSITSPRRSGHGDLVSAFVHALWVSSLSVDCGAEEADRFNRQPIRERGPWDGVGSGYERVW
jgi:hypothetical protein